MINAVLGDAYGVRASTRMASTVHSQHGVAVLVGLDADVTVSEPGAAPIHARIIMIPPDVAHEAESPGPTLGFIYDPEHNAGVTGFASLAGGARALDGRLGERIAGAIRAQRASLAAQSVLTGLSFELGALLAHDAPRRGLDRRVGRALEALRRLDTDRDQVLAGAGISAPHLQALFVRDVGLPIRSYRLWRRLLRAVQAYAHSDATSAAHLAGFADLAHFSRTCRRMLGYAPTTLRRGNVG